MVDNLLIRHRYKLRSKNGNFNLISLRLDESSDCHIDIIIIVARYSEVKVGSRVGFSSPFVISSQMSAGTHNFP